jgi:hypothetical protein
MLLRTLEDVEGAGGAAAAEGAEAAAEDEAVGGMEGAEAAAGAEEVAGGMEGEEVALADICTILEDGEDGADGADGAAGRQLGSPTGIILGVAIGAPRANVKTVVRLMAALSREMALMNVCGLLIAIVVRFKSAI